MLLSEPYTEAVDLWSLGVILYVMLCGVHPFQTDNGIRAQYFFKSEDAKTFENILSGHYRMESEWQAISPEAKSLIKSLFNKLPEARPSAADCLTHPWLQ